MPKNETSPRTEAGYEAFAASDVGRSRLTNEDFYGLSLMAQDRDSEDEPAGNFVVCDGMGGAAAGEVASRMAVESVMRQMRRRTLTAGQLQQMVRAANASLHAWAETDPALAGMGTTLVALAIRGRQAWVANVGDSRCYRLRDGQMQRLTEDHSLVEEQVRLGQLTPEQAEVSPMRNVITRAIGTQQEVEVDVIEIEVLPGDLYLLASDGLTREISERRIAGILRETGPLDLACTHLIEAANEAGGRDNITCLLARAR